MTKSGLGDEGSPIYRALFFSWAIDRLARAAKSVDKSLKSAVMILEKEWLIT